MSLWPSLDGHQNDPTSKMKSFWKTCLHSLLYLHLKKIKHWRPHLFVVVTFDDASRLRKMSIWAQLRLGSESGVSTRRKDLPGSSWFLFPIKPTKELTLCPWEKKKEKKLNTWSDTISIPYIKKTKTFPIQEFLCACSSSDFLQTVLIHAGAANLVGNGDKSFRQVTTPLRPHPGVGSRFGWQN